MIVNEILLALGLAAFTAGLALGAWLEGYNWRAAAVNGRRKESFGRLYTVVQE